MTRRERERRAARNREILGHRLAAEKQGYFPPAPHDTLHDLRGRAAEAWIFPPLYIMIRFACDPMTQKELDRQNLISLVMAIFIAFGLGIALGIWVAH